MAIDETTDDRVFELEVQIMALEGVLAELLGLLSKDTEMRTRLQHYRDSIFGKMARIEKDADTEARADVLDKMHKAMSELLREVPRSA